MSLFTVVEDAFAILCCKGVYRQCRLYVRGVDAYAAWGGGFVGLRGEGATTAPNVRYVELDLPERMLQGRGKMGRLLLAERGTPAALAIEHRPA